MRLNDAAEFYIDKLINTNFLTHLLGDDFPITKGAIAYGGSQMDKILVATDLGFR